ncbi:MAG: bifunctional hydroxymethylpyrimidine kinase/phosphomethylpyrimidine kinase [Gammaproteobacteria bacterium]|nr:bifunctional hydroxymethylpyrimidine kinase/phosphomethylpyrimidine kinase [Gammaproteobacteria bacterium]
MSTVLVIGGSDSSGGAGITRDAQTLAQLGARMLPVVTAVTAQTDARVAAVHIVSAQLVRAQMAAAFSSGPVQAIKTGMLATRAIVRAVAAALPPSAPPLVIDPVLASSSGGELLDRAGQEAMCVTLLPRAALLTPNIPEAAALLGTQPATSEEQLLHHAEALLRLGPAAVLLKGGHAEGPEAVDLLLARDAAPLWLRAPRVNATRRGTGCALASAIAAGLAAGLDLPAACAQAKQHVVQLLLEGK